MVIISHHGSHTELRLNAVDQWFITGSDKHIRSWQPWRTVTVAVAYYFNMNRFLCIYVYKSHDITTKCFKFKLYGYSFKIWWTHSWISAFLYKLYWNYSDFTIQCMHKLHRHRQHQPLMRFIVGRGVPISRTIFTPNDAIWNWLNFPMTTNLIYYDVSF